MRNLLTIIRLMYQVRENLIEDFVSLIAGDVDEDEKNLRKELAGNLLTLARKHLDRLPPDEDILRWWPSQQMFNQLFPLIKMLLAIPASSADSERAFSSASFTLDQRRTRTDIENFRSEHRIRRYITASADAQSQDGRKTRLRRMEKLIDRLAEKMSGAPQDNGVH